MNKPKSLRAALENALPDLKKNPDRLHVFIEAGQIVSTQAQNFCFEYHYTLNLVIIDYTAHADTVFIPLLVWVREHQPDLLTGQPNEQIAFEAEQISNDATDISITLKLTEIVVVTEQAGRLLSKHMPEPKLQDVAGPTGWQLFGNGDDVLQTPLPIDVLDGNDD